MFCLIRREGEKIVITDTETGQKIYITVVQIGHRKVRIGLDADHKYVINREETETRSEE